MAWLSAKAVKVGGTVDREKGAILGYVVAQEGDFKSEGRGSFDLKGLKKIVTLMNRNPGGTKSRFTHPTMCDDGLGKFLGRAKNARMDTVKLNRDGEVVLLHCVRADLYFNQTALDTPPSGGKPLGVYVMDLTESDPDAISSSVVIDPEVVDQLDAKGRPVLDANGNAKPPLWYPLAIHASDIVDTGDAVDGLLSAGVDFMGLPDGIARQGFEMLKTQFAGKSREFAREHLSGWLDRALSVMYGDEEEVVEEIVPVEEKVEPLGMSADVAKMKLALAERGAS